MTSPALSSIARGVPDVGLLRALAATNRPALERMIAISIDILDAIDLDPDLEPCGDDEPLECDGDAEDVAWSEEASLVGFIVTNVHREDDEAGCEPVASTREGRELIDARRAHLGLAPLRRRG